jgi:hypothetical protein
MEPELIRDFNKRLRDYTDALLLCGSPVPSDWDQARRRLDLLQPFFVFAEDPELVRQFRAGREQARKELASRGVILHSTLALWEPYDKRKWDDARRTLMSAGEVGLHLLVKSLFNLLLNGQYREVWIHARFGLVEAGPVALETARELARVLEERVPPDAPIFPQDDLTQVFLVLIGFGDPGRGAVEAWARHPKTNVRRVVARAFGEALDPAGLPVLARFVREDREFAVRWAAAQALGRMAPARSEAGRVLVERIRAETDRTVRLAILEAIGELHYEEAVPDLMAVVEVPSLETATAAMSALYRITGEKFTRREQWKKWYDEVYPKWKVRPRR